jgi:hypothetical protein
MSLYGCRNKPRPTAGAGIRVQDGWVYGIFDYEAGHTDRIARIVEAPYAMSTECQYTKTHAGDAQCTGCAHRNKDAA